jgi:parallel beta-helix repeat protein
VRTDFSNLTNINSSGNHHGIYLGSSHNNTLTSNIM